MPKRTFGCTRWDDILEATFGDNDTLLFNEFEFHIIGTATDVCVVSNALILRSLYPFAKIVVHIDMCAPLFVMGQVAATYIMKTNAIDVEGE